jgi:hypothetical protein
MHSSLITEVNAGRSRGCSRWGRRILAKIAPGRQTLSYRGPVTGDLRARLRELVDAGPAVAPDNDPGDAARLRLAEGARAVFFEPVPDPFREVVAQFLELAPETATRPVWLQDVPDSRLLALLMDPALGPELWRPPEGASWRRRRRTRRADLAAARIAARSVRAPAYWLARREVTYVPGSWLGTVPEDSGAFYVLAHDSLLGAGGVTVPGQEPTVEELTGVLAGFLHLVGVTG